MSRFRLVVERSGLKAEILALHEFLRVHQATAPTLRYYTPLYNMIQRLDYEQWFEQSIDHANAHIIMMKDLLREGCDIIQRLNMTPPAIIDKWGLDNVRKAQWETYRYFRDPLENEIDQLCLAYTETLSLTRVDVSRLSVATGFQRLYETNYFWKDYDHKEIGLMIIEYLHSKIEQTKNDHIVPVSLVTKSATNKQ